MPVLARVRAIPGEATRASRGLPAVLSHVRARLSALVSAARAWQWGPVLGRLVAAAMGLVLLGAIGRSALARNILSTDPPAPDAGVAPPQPKVADVPAAVVASTPVGVAPPGAGLLAASTLPSSVTSPASAREPAHGHATPDDPVYLNQATLADLHRLPGVGPKRAEAILALRGKLGHFRQIEDLLKVKGIGRSSLKKLRPLVRLDPPPAAVVHASDAGPDSSVSAP